MSTLADLVALRARALDLGVELARAERAPGSWPAGVSYFDTATISGVVFAVGGASLDEHVRRLEEVVELVEGAKLATT